MITFRPIEPSDALAFMQHGGPQSFADIITPEYSDRLSRMPVTLAAIRDGIPIALMGLQELWPGRALAWSFIGQNIGADMLAITRECRKVLDNCDYRRVELHVESWHGAGERWATMLGFKFESSLASFFPDGGDGTMWVRIK